MGCLYGSLCTSSCLFCSSYKKEDYIWQSEDLFDKSMEDDYNKEMEDYYKKIENDFYNSQQQQEQMREEL